MSSRPPSTSSSRTVTQVVPRGTPDEAGDVGLLQTRLRIYLFLLLAITVGLYLVFFITRVILDKRPIVGLELALHEVQRLLLIGALVLGGAALSWAKLSRRALLAIDAVSAMLFTVAWLIAPPEYAPEIRPEMLALLGITLMLVARAALVPSTAERTVVVGLLAMTPLFVIGPVYYRPEQTILGVNFRAFVRVTLVVFGVSTIVVTSIVSHMIYHLRRSLGRAMQLGPYELGRILGEGGMGSVYEARHAALQRRTALKLIRPEKLDPKMNDRFKREAQLTSALSHPNTVALYDYGQTADGICYYAMELVEGVTLKELVKTEGPLPAGRALHLLRQVAASLAEAHKKSVIHRDIKDSNIMVCYREGDPDFIKVLDFGLAKRFANADQSAVERSSVFMGTPHYMAPETMAGLEPVGPAVDVYAVGVLGYYLLTGGFPFEGKNLMALATAHISQPPLPPSLRTKNEIPRDLEDVIMKCLAKQPEDRFADGWDLLLAFDDCTEHVGWTPIQAQQWWEAHAHNYASLNRSAITTTMGARTKRDIAVAGDTIPDASGMGNTEKTHSLWLTRRKDSTPPSEPPPTKRTLGE